MAPGLGVPGGVSFQSGGVLSMNVNMTASKNTLMVPVKQHQVLTEATREPRSEGRGKHSRVGPLVTTGGTLGTPISPGAL